MQWINFSATTEGAQTINLPYSYTGDYVISRTTISSELYDNKYRTEWYMYPEEAKENGVVTHIVGKDCGMDDIL